MRTLILTLALSLAACSPAPAPSSAAPDQAAAPAEPSAANADALALQRAPAEGAWAANADEGTFAVGFGAPESEYQLSIICTSGSGEIKIMSGHELAPDQATTLRLITPTRVLELPAQSSNEGLPDITASIARTAPEHDALITVLGTPGDRFAVDAGGEVTVFPWNDGIASTLNECR